MKRALFLLPIIFILFTVSAATFADDKGTALAKAYFDLKKASDASYTGTMMIYDSKNNRRMRKVKIFTMDKSDMGKSGRKATLMSFLEPADVKDTRFLSINSGSGNDDQRIYLPALKKVKKIASSDKGGSLVGSDLFYYDIESKNFEDFSYTYIRDDELSGKKCSIVEMKPKSSDCPYSKMDAWISKEDNYIYKYEMYDKTAGEKFKSIEAASIQTISGVIIADKIIANNFNSISKTELELSDIKLNTGVQESTFSVQNLEK